MPVEENPKTILELFTSNKVKDNLKDIASKYALPALLASAGTGAIGGILASNNVIEHESKAARRKRILRSILFPALTTAAISGTAGLAGAVSDIDTESLDKAIGVSDDNRFLSAIKDSAKPLGALGGAAWGGGLEVSMPSTKDSFLNSAKNKMQKATKSFKPNLFTPLLYNAGTKESTIDGSKTLLRLLGEKGARFIPRARWNNKLGRTALGTLIGYLLGTGVEKGIDFVD